LDRGLDGDVAHRQATISGEREVVGLHACDQGRAWRGLDCQLTGGTLREAAETKARASGCLGKNLEWIEGRSIDSSASPGEVERCRGHVTRVLNGQHNGRTGYRGRRLCDCTQVDCGCTTKANSDELRRLDGCTRQGCLRRVTGISTTANRDLESSGFRLRRGDLAGNARKEDHERALVQTSGVASGLKRASGGRALTRLINSEGRNQGVAQDKWRSSCAKVAHRKGDIRALCRLRKAAEVVGERLCGHARKAELRRRGPLANRQLRCRGTRHLRCKTRIDAID
jgi:hypothetical protein